MRNKPNKLQLLYPFIMFFGEFIFWGTVFKLVLLYIPSAFTRNIVFLNTLGIGTWISAAFVGLIFYNVGKRGQKTSPISLDVPALKSTFRYLLLPVIAIYYSRIPLLIIRLFSPYFGTVVGISVQPIGPRELVIWIIAFPLIGTFGELAGFYGAFAVIRDADKIRERDARNPVLYLRSFQNEDKQARPPGRHKDIKLMLEYNRTKIVPHEAIRMQLLFGFVMNSIGPYIALAHPQQKAIRVSIGPAIKYVPDNEWQEVVSAWMIEAAAIVFDIGTTAGVLWEIKFIIERIDPRKILFIVPEDAIEYSSFVKQASHLFPYGLPNHGPPSCLIAFDRGWSPLLLPKEKFLIDSLSIFLNRLPLISEHNRSVHNADNDN